MFKNSSQIYKKLGKFLVYAYLILFPLGQLLKIGFKLNLGNLEDLLVLLALPFYFSKNVKRPFVDGKVRNFLFVSIFSLALSVGFFNLPSVLYGGLYLVRIFSYYVFGILVYNLTVSKKIKPQKILDFLIFAAILAGALGWVQYLLWPNLVFLKYLNWDDHLNRLVGTYYDPAFIGMILAMGSLLSVSKFLKTYSKPYLFSGLFLTISTLFTYSRASFVALFVGLMVLLTNRKNFKKILISFVAAFTFMILLLPKKLGEGNNLLRTASITARLSNYSIALKIIRENPLFGVGLNNICAYQVSNFGVKPSNHACSGTDSSLLFVVATTGVVGFMVFCSLIYGSFYGLKNKLTWSISASILVHSIFTQSLFYSFVMGFLAVYLGVSKLKE